MIALPDHALIWFEVRWNPDFNRAITISGPYTNSASDRFLLQFFCNGFAQGVEYYGVPSLPHGMFNFIMADPETYHTQLQSLHCRTPAPESEPCFMTNFRIEQNDSLSQALRILKGSMPNLTPQAVEFFVTPALTVHPDYPFPFEATPKEECVDLNAVVQAPWIVAARETFPTKAQAEAGGYKMLVAGKEADPDNVYDFEDKGGCLRGTVETKSGLIRRIATVELTNVARVARFHKHWGRWTWVVPEVRGSMMSSDDTEYPET